MKKKVLLLLGLIATLMLLGCQQQSNSSGTSEGRLYYVEGASIEKNEIINILEPYQSKYSSSDEMSFDEIKTIRNALRNCAHSNFASNADVPRKDVEDYFTAHGCTPSEKEEIMEKLDDRENTIQFFNTKDENYFIYLYIEKTE